MTIVERFINEPRISLAEQAALNRKLWAGDQAYASPGDVAVSARAHPDDGLVIAGESVAGGIITGDVAAVLPRLRAAGESFDIIIADPPYNIGKDFGNNRDTMPLSEYIEWTKGWLDDCFAMLTDDGLIYVYGFPEIMAHISVNYPIDEQRWLVWHYTNKTVPSSQFWQRSHESILCLWKPGRRRPSLEVDQIREPYTPNYLRCAGKERRETPSRFGAEGKRTVYNAHANGALPRDVIKTPALAGGAGRSERWFMCRSCDMTLYPPGELADHRTHDVVKHPTQKPMELTKRLLMSRIGNTGGRALIPFAGSGSECVVAQSMGINFLGIEINPEYAQFARSWIAYGGGRQPCIA